MRINICVGGESFKTPQLKDLTTLSNEQMHKLGDRLHERMSDASRALGRENQTYGEANRMTKGKVVKFVHYIKLWRKEMRRRGFAHYED